MRYFVPVLIAVALALGVAICADKPERSPPKTVDAATNQPDARRAEKVEVERPLPRSLDATTQKRQVEDWRAFRRAFPGHMQVLTLSEIYSDGSRSLIVAEPPPHVRLPDLTAIAPTELAASEVMTQTIGHDGWAKDVVFNLPPGIDEPAVRQLVDKLSSYLFGTKDGAYYLQLPLDEERLQTKYPLNLRVSGADLRKWATQELFLVKSARATLPAIDPRDGAIFYSADPGVVAWAIPRGSTLSKQRSVIRRFALDSDLVLGAVQRPDGTIFVLGRERVVPVDVLPPLRTETIELLASVDTDQLAQSYERNALFAGKFKPPWDWAPAFLSPQLIDTELGGLLNIADQLLKSWTEHGDVRYQNFDYSDPPRFPFDEALSAELGGSSLLFNWNTTGVGYLIEADGFKIYGVGRTGALPVIYRPNEDGSNATVIHGDVEKVKAAEEAGYDYYTSLNDPTLARVVQYTALYQCFRAFDIQKENRQWPDKDKAVASAMQRRLLSVLKDVSRSTDAEIRSQAESLAAGLIELGKDERWSSRKTRFSMELFAEKTRAELTRSFVTEGEHLRNAVKSAAKSQGMVVLQDVAFIATLPRGTDLDVTLFNKLSAPESIEATLDLVLTLRKDRRALNMLADLDQVRREYSQAMGNGSAEWLHTQSIVVSHAEGNSVLSIGGHNVRAEATKLLEDASVARNTVKARPDGGIHLNPSDSAAAPELARLAARERGNPALESLLTKELRSLQDRPPLQNSISLGLGDRPPRTSPRGFGDGGRIPPGPPRQHLEIPDSADQPPLPGAIPPSEPKVHGRGVRGLAIETPGGNDFTAAGLVIERRSGKVDIYRRIGKETFAAEAWNEPDAYTAILEEMRAGGRKTDSEPLQVLLGAGYEGAGDGQAFLKSLRVQAQRYPAGRPVIFFERMTPEARRSLDARITGIANKSANASDAGGGLVTVRGKLDATTRGGQTLPVEFDVSLRGSIEELTSGKVNSALENAAKNAVESKASVLRLGAKIYQELQELTPAARPADAVIRVKDVLDFHIVLDMGGARNEQESDILIERTTRSARRLEPCLG